MAFIKAEFIDWQKDGNGGYRAGATNLESRFQNVYYEDFLYLASLVVLRFVSATPNYELNEKYIQAFLSDIITMISQCNLIEEFKKQDKDF